MTNIDSKAKRAAEQIWDKYERHLDNPRGANQDKDCFIQTVTDLIRLTLKED